MHSQAGSSLQRTCRLIGCKLFSSFCVSPPSPMPEDQKNHSGSQLQYQWEQHKQQLEVMMITRRRIILTVFCSRQQIGDVGFCRYCQGSPVKVENPTTGEEGQDLKKPWMCHKTSCLAYEGRCCIYLIWPYASCQDN